MAANIVPLDKEKHRGKRIRRAFAFPQVTEQQVIPLVVHEIPGAATEFPIIFIKDAQTGQFHLVALCGLTPNENLYASEDSWDGAYVPAILRNYPLSLVPGNESSEKLFVCVDEDSTLLNDVEGELLFKENGDETGFLKSRTAAIMAFSNNMQVTGAFVKMLLEKELLMSKTLQLDLVGESGLNLSGIYAIDEEKLKGLNDESFLDLRQRGFLPVIYAHLASLNQVYRLSQKKHANAN